MCVTYLQNNCQTNKSGDPLSAESVCEKGMVGSAMSSANACHSE